MLLIPSAIDIHMSKDKNQIALWNGCEEHVASNHMIGITVFKILWYWYDFFYKPLMILFWIWSNHIKSILFEVSESVYDSYEYLISFKISDTLN